MMSTAEIVKTRFSRSFNLNRPDATAPSLLVKIYPVCSIEQPLELIDKPLIVGREARCELSLSDDSVSRRHGLLEPVEGGHLISDLGSTNGTYVNEIRLEHPQQLRSGDRIRFGNQIFKYVSYDRVESQYYEVVFKLMTTDGLTLVHNKRYLLETLEREIEQSRRHPEPMCVMMLDLDKFKSVNDTYGHLAGDMVLVEFARRAKSALRSGDLLARYGGEEFAMVLTRTTLPEAAEVGERIRMLTAAEPVVFEQHQIPMTVSIGICCEGGHQEVDANQLLARADEKLYTAKLSGRNQVLY